VDPDLWSRLVSAGTSAGLAKMGVTDIEPFDDVAATLHRRRRAGLHGRLRFTFADPETATDVAVSLPWARRVIACSFAYLPQAGSPSRRPGTARLARFASEPHYERLRVALDVVRAALEAEGYRASVVVDDNRLVDRAAAVRSGVGWWGKNTMVLDPKHGPWLLLGNVVTDAPIGVTDPMVRDCGTCSACMPACPTGALVAPGVLDARRCIAHWAQVPGDIPISMRAAMEDRLYGCDDCLEACPPGSSELARIANTGGPEDTKGDVELTDVLSLDDATLLDRFGHLYIPRRDPDHLRRNALVVLGNTGGVDALELAAPFLTHPSAMLRRHAEWAVAQIGGPLARAMLAASGAADQSPDAVPTAPAGRDPIEGMDPGQRDGPD
jgi:epoxyqueuosine reductase